MNKEGGDLSEERRMREELLKSKEEESIIERLKKSRNINRENGEKVNDLKINEMKGKILRWIKGIGNEDEEREDCWIIEMIVDKRIEDRKKEIIKIRKIEMMEVENLILKEDERIRIEDRRIEKEIRIGWSIGNKEIKERNMDVKGGIEMRVMRGEEGWRERREEEKNRRENMEKRNVKSIGGGIKDMVNWMNGEVEGNELKDRIKEGKRRKKEKKGKEMLSNRCIEEEIGKKLIKKKMSDIVGEMILGELIKNDEEIGIEENLLRNGIEKRLEKSKGKNLSERRNIRVGRKLKRRRIWRGRKGIGIVLLRIRILIRRIGIWRRRRKDIGRNIEVEKKKGNRSIEIKELGELIEKKFENGELIKRLELNSRIVGIDLGDKIEGSKIVELFIEKFGEIEIINGRGKWGNENLYGNRKKLIELEKNISIEIGRIRIRIMLGKIGRIRENVKKLNVDLIKILLGWKEILDKEVFEMIDRIMLGENFMKLLIREVIGRIGNGVEEIEVGKNLKNDRKIEGKRKLGRKIGWRI